MAGKDFKTIDEQLDILRSRGLLVEDEEKAKLFLLRNNYYRISGYSLTLRRNDKFFPSVTFQNIIDIYNFDHDFRHILLRYLEIIEVQMKSIYAYAFTKQHGPTGYLNCSYFSDCDRHKSIIDKADHQKERRLQHEAYLKHFINDLQEDIPLWAYVDLFTISDISILYSISKKELRDCVAREFGFLKNNGADILKRYMHSMTIIRNLCAHGSRLYNRLFEQKPSLNKYDKSLLRVNNDGTIDNAHLYGFILIMKRLLPSDTFIEMKSAIVGLCDKYPFVRMDYYGFREDWKERL